MLVRPGRSQSAEVHDVGVLPAEVDQKAADRGLGRLVVTRDEVDVEPLNTEGSVITAMLNVLSALTSRACGNAAFSARL